MKDQISIPSFFAPMNAKVRIDNMHSTVIWSCGKLREQLLLHLRFSNR